LESLAVAQRRQTATVIKNVFTCERWRTQPPC
jgi:hypothetical protein